MLYKPPFIACCGGIMAESKKDDDTSLVLFIIGLFVALLIIILPFIWSQAKPEMNAPVVYDCEEGASCQICDEQDSTICVTGICDAQANCIAPMQKNDTSKVPLRGLRALVR